MKLAAEMIEQISEIADELYMDYEVIAVRTQEVPFVLGKMDHVSKVWVDGDETDEDLNGLCAVKVDQIDNAHTYFGDYIAVIAGNHYIYGEDPSEVIISDPIVAKILA